MDWVDTKVHETRLSSFKQWAKGIPLPVHHRHVTYDVTDNVTGQGFPLGSARYLPTSQPFAK